MVNRLNTVDEIAEALRISLPPRQVERWTAYETWRAELYGVLAAKRLAWLLTLGRPGGYRGPLRFEVPHAK